MIEKVIFDDKIVLYWDRQAEYQIGCQYCIRYGAETAYTNKTHFTIKKTAICENSVTITVDLYGKDGKAIKRLAKETLLFAKPKKRIDVTQAPYNAVGDGKVLNTAAIQSAIDACGKDDCVYFPSGVFMTGALTLHSDMELYVDKGATLQGTAYIENYLPKIKSRFEGLERECYRSLLNLGEIDSNNGYTSHNVIIRGGGAIFGGGRGLMIDTLEKESGVPFAGDDTEEKYWVTRGRLLHVCNAENIIVADVTIGMASAWNLHFIYSKNVVTFGCKIVSTGVDNGDGWDPDSSEDCTIFNCDFDTRDDMIAIKSGKNPEGNIINRPSRNIKVFDCRCVHGHGLAMGSEMSGGIENVYVWDCDMQKSRCGLEVKGRKERGGYVRNVYVYDSSFSILAIRSVDYGANGECMQKPPVLENYCFENIMLTGVCLKHTDETWDESAIILEGFDEEKYHLKNIRLKNVTVKRRVSAPKHTLSVCYVQGITIDNLVCK